MGKYESKRTHFEVLRSQLDNERSTFVQHWRQLSDFILPRRSRFTVSDVNSGDRRNQNIIDATATMAVRTLRSGMMSGVTSPARPWFRLQTPDPGLNEISTVKTWLHEVSSRMSNMFLKSNLYNVLPIVYGDIGVFGTAAMAIEEDLQDGIRAYPFPIGSYYIANDEKLKVNVFMREFQLTVRQLIGKFGGAEENNNQIDWSVFSTHVRNMWDAGQLEEWIEVTHVIMPNPDHDPRKLESKYKKFLSCYYERGAESGRSSFSTEGDQLLSEKGYDYFPVLCPRWELVGEDVYGTDCPGMIALGDVKQLQLGERRGMQAIDKMINPPMTGPSSLRNSKASILPGDITYLDASQNGDGFRPAHETRFDINALESKQAQVRGRIQRSFFEDLFLMLASSDRRQITAREIDERHEEKLLALGPVLEQLNQDLLDPLIDVAFDIMVKQGNVPPPPEEIQGISLKVDYISVMAQAQKLVGIGGIERFAGFIGQAASADPKVLDKVNADQMIDVYGDILSLPPGIIRSDEEVADIRSQRADAAAAEQQNQQMMAQANAAKQISEIPMDKDTALTRMLSQANAGSLVEGG